MENSKVVIDNDGLSDAEIETILRLRNIAVVGMSRYPTKPAHYVPRYLKERGYNITPVNPSANEILGLKCYRSLLDVPEPIDVVDVFRPSQDVPPIVDAAIAKSAKVVWMQLGIHNPDAETKAGEQGITVVWNRCIMTEHKRLLGRGSP